MGSDSVSAWLLMGWQFTLAEFVGGPVMIVFLALAAVLGIRFARTGGGMMLRMMGGSPDVTNTEDINHFRPVPTTICETSVTRRLPLASRDVRFEHSSVQR